MSYSSHYTSACWSCPAGQYNPYSGNSRCYSCPGGYYCPTSSTTYYGCSAGRYASGGASSCSAVGAGYYSYSRASSRSACPTGRYGSSSYGTTSSCSGCCSAGYYCPAGSSSSAQTYCGSSTVYCPSCTTSKLAIYSGEYGTGGGSTTRTGKTSCPAGYYCVNGYYYSCPAGRYGSSTRLTSSNCNGNCAAGYVCPSGSRYSTVKKCGEADSSCALSPGLCYCPAGSGSVSKAADGYYSTPVTADWKLRTGVVKCTGNDVCLNGVKVPPIKWSSGGCTSDNKGEVSIGEYATGSAGNAIAAELSQGYSSGSISYSLLSVTPSSGCTFTSGVFSLSSSTGQITVAKGIDYESCPQYTLSVRAAWSKATTSADHLTCAVKLSVVDKNEAPTITRCSALNVNEGSPVDTPVGAPLQASDPDRGQASEFYFTGPATPFQIQKCSGQVTVAKAELDYRTKKTYTIPVTVKDDGSPVLSDTCTLTITINDVSEPPVIADKTCSVSENTPKDTTICQVTASDPDGDSLTYTVSRKDDPDAIAVNSNGEIYVRQAVLDFETKKVYSIEVTVSDGTNTAKSTVIVNVADANDAPAMPSGSVERSIAENSAAGSTVGAAVSGTDADAGDKLTYTISDTSGFFEVVSTTGQIKVKSGATIDFETAKTHQVTIVATDNSGSTASSLVVISVLDVNEQPKFSSSTFSRSVSEAAAINDAVGDAISASDPDVSQTPLFTITSGNTGSVFVIDSVSGQIRVNKQLDFETTSSYTLGLKIEDSGSPKLSDTATVTVTIDDANEAPVFKNSKVTKTVDEGAADGTVIIALGSEATDPEGDSITFSILGRDDNDIFAISSSSLVVGTGKGELLDYEGPKSSYSLEIQASDGTSTAALTLIVNVADVAEAPKFVEDEDGGIRRAVQESASTGTNIGAAITATDQDDGDELTYTITSQPAGDYFTIVSSTGQLKAAKTLPTASGTGSTFSVGVKVVDKTSKSDTATVTVGLENTNDPPVITGATVTVKEDVAIGSVISGVFTASDPNDDPLEFTIISGALNAFQMDSSGKLTVIGKLDFETRTSYTLNVRVFDIPVKAGALPLSDDTTVTINIQDVNEPPTLKSGLSFDIVENSAVGTSVGTAIVATDEDANERFTFSIASGNSAGAFAITNDGQLKVAKTSAINYETTKSFALDVQVTDSGSNTATSTVRVLVTNANDAPQIVIVDPNITVSEATVVGTKVATLQATDEDEGDTIVFSLAASVTDTTFAINPSTGAITLAKALDFETRVSYTLSVFAKDGGGLTSYGTVYITVGDAPDAPIYTGPTSASISENSIVGTTVFTATASDQDANEMLRFAITDGNDIGVFQISSTTGKVTVRDSSRLNYESYSAFTLRVTVTDKDSLTATGVVAVTVLDLNEKPVLTTTLLQVAEMDSVDGEGKPFYSVEGDGVGQSPVGFTDEDFAQNHTIRIVSGNTNGAFAFGEYVSPADLASGTPSPVDASTDAAVASSGFMLYVRNITALDFESASQIDGTPAMALVVEIQDSGIPQQSVQGTIQVNILNRNERPTVEQAPIRKIDENSAVNEVIGEPLEASDPDLGDILNFKIEQGNDDGLFKIDPCGGQLKVARDALDFETRSHYHLFITVTDDGASTPGPARLSASTNVTVMILDVNEPPVVVPATRFVDENTVAPTSFGLPIAVSDQDFGQTHTWSIVHEDSAAVGLFDIDPATGMLKVKTSLKGFRQGLDYEYMNSFTITVRATDDGTRPANLFAEAQISVKLNDLNEPPVVPNNQNVTIPENSPPNTATDKAVQGEDFDAGSSVTFSIVADGSLGSRLFVIDRTTGLLKVAPIPDSAPNGTTLHPELNYEMLTRTWLTVRVNDSILTTDANVNIVILDVNEPPELLPATLNVSEAALAGTVVSGSPIMGTDVDADQRLSYRIAQQTPSAAFTLDALTGELVVSTSAKLDYEGVNKYFVTVTATDDGKGRLSATQSYLVSILDAPERPVVAATLAASVPENSLGGVDVLNVTATDVDFGDVLTYTISSATPSSVMPYFAIGASTGRVTVAPGTVSGNLNHESHVDGKVTLVVTVTDSYDLSATSTVTVTITDVNEPPSFEPPAVVYKRARTSGAIGKPLVAYVLDEDVGDQHSFSLVSVTPSDPGFELDRFGSLTVPPAIAEGVDFSKGKVYTLTLIVSDLLDLQVTSQLVVEFTENNIAPELSSLSLSIDENPTPDFTVTFVAADDLNKDDDPPQDVSYTIAAVGESVNRPFPFNITTVKDGLGIGTLSRGRIYVTDPSIVDFETRTVFYGAITVTDSFASAPLETRAIITININDLPEDPKFSSPTIALAVHENSPPGTQVGTTPIVASDPDASDAGLLRYAWTDPVAASSFALDEVTGVVTVASGAVMNHEATASFSLGVKVTDATSRFDIATVTITVIDVNEPPVFTAPATVSLSEAAGLNTIVAQMTASDEDAGSWGVLSFFLTDDDGANGAFRVDATTGRIMVDQVVDSDDAHKAMLDFEDRTTYNLAVGVRDAGGLNRTSIVKVSLTDANDIALVGFMLRGVASGRAIAPAGSMGAQGDEFDQYATLSADRVDVLAPTSGGVQVWLVGRGFGPTARKLTNELGGITSAEAHQFKATAISRANRNNTASAACTLVNDTHASCSIPEGAGTQWSWDIEVVGTAQLYNSVTRPSWQFKRPITGYIAPKVTRVFRPDFVPGAPVFMPTLGDSVFRVTGTDLGNPAKGFEQVVRYGPVVELWDSSYGPSRRQDAISCRSITPHTEIECRSRPGLGAKLEFYARVEGQDSPAFVGDIATDGMRYASPSTTKVVASATGVTPQLQTSGGEQVVITGANFGPDRIVDVSVWYGEAGFGLPATATPLSTPIPATGPGLLRFKATECRVIGGAHNKIQCSSTEGVGKNLVFAVAMRGLASTVPTTSAAAGLAIASYLPPVVNEAGGPGWKASPTKGNVAFTLEGAEFGPAGLVVPVVRYGPVTAPTRYEAVGCVVSAAHQGVTCQTAPGTGFGHMITLSIRGQSTTFLGNEEQVPVDPVGFEMGTNMTTAPGVVGLAYAPPVVTRYDGPGASDANTKGSEVVIIEGLEFGPLSSGIDRVTYGLDNSSKEYVATNCSLSVPHLKVVCSTAEGAGAGLRWVVWIDGQRSRSPTTDYHEPVIESLTGAGAADGFSDGSQVVDIVGKYFGPHGAVSYLEDVTYGRTGREFIANNCTVVSHNLVRCLSTAGTGRGLRWRMSVRGQDSGLSAVSSNYADPSIRTVDPPTGSTEGNPQVRLFGLDFGIREKRVGNDFKFSQTANVTFDPATNLTSSTVPGLRGAVPCTDRICLLWDNRYYLAVENSSDWTVSKGAPRPLSAHSVAFHVPEGAGKDIPMQLVLKTGPGGLEAFGEAHSNVMLWSYKPPVISSDIGKELVRHNGAVRTKLTIAGEDFSRDPEVYIYDSDATFQLAKNQDSLDSLLVQCTVTIPHREVQCIQDSETGFIRVGAGGQYSNAREFSRETPAIGNLEGASWGDLRLPTAGGQVLTFEVRSIDKPTFAMSIEGRPCQTLIVSDPFRKPESEDDLNREYNKITCVTPEGAGVDQRLAISAAGLTPPPQLVSFAPPTITGWRAVTDADDTVMLNQGLPPTTGSLIEVTGGNFSSACVDLTACLTAELGLFRPEAGPGLPQVAVETQFTLVSWTHDRVVARIAAGEGKGFLLRVTAFGQAAARAFSYAPPEISTHTRSGPAAGGSTITVSGANFGINKPTVTLRRLAGRAFRSDGVTPWTSSPVVVNCPVVVSTHTMASCILPPGQGRFWTVTVTSAGQSGAIAYAVSDPVVLDTQAFAYDAPTLSSVGPFEGPTQGGFLTTLTGVNLGQAELEIMVRVPDSEPLTSSDWSSAVVVPAASEVLLSGAASGSVWLHDETLASRSSIVAAAMANPAATLASLPKQSWRDALTVVPGKNGAPPSTLDAEEVNPLAIAVAAILASTNGSHTDAAATFRFPEGQGERIEVRVNVAGQTSNVVTFAYERPNVTVIVMPKEIDTEGSWPADDRNAADREVLSISGSSFGLNSTQRTSVLFFRPASEYRVSGRSLASMTASGFNPSPEEIADAVECTTSVVKNAAGLWMSSDSKVYSHTQLHCPVPSGWGRQLRLVVKVMERYSTPWMFSYDPAEVDYFTPNTPSALGTQVMSIFGKNFGPSPTPLDIKIGGKDCNGSSWVRDSSNQGKPYLRCVVSEDEAGVRNMTIFVAGQDANPVLADGRLRLRCPYNWYGIEEKCLACPIGGVCKGDLEWPYAAPGFWDLQPNNTIEAADPYRKNCPAERLDSAHRSYCFYPVGCKPREGCTGNNTCLYGYEGVRCTQCLRGEFYRRAGECVKCPDLPLVQLIAFVVAIMAAGVGAYAFQRFKIHLASVQIAIDYMQVLAMIARAKVPWPPLIKEILYVLSAFNLNLEIAAPECILPDLGYPLKWAAVALLPVAAFVMFGLLHVAIVLKKICMGRDRKKLCNHSPSFTGSMLMLGFYAYMVEARNSLDVFNCSPVVPDDGFTYMESVIERCWEPNGMQMFLAPFAGIALALYSFGYPAILGYLLFTRRDRVRQDQILRVFGIGDSRLTNPNSYVLRKYLSKLYQHFRPELYAWVLVIVGRKAFISVVALMFRENPAYQLACALLVMFVAYALQVRFVPYMPPSTFEAEIQRHQRLVREGNPIHQSIASNIAPAIAQMRHEKRQRARSMWGLDAPSLRKVAVTNFFDYNSVEAVLLGCGVFTCLAGIMFQSGALDLTYRPEVAAQAETITWVLTLVLVLSLLYVVAVVGNETYMQFSSGRTVSTKKKGTGKAGKGGKGGKGDKASETSGNDLMDEGDIIASPTHTVEGAVTSDSAQLNPMFMSNDGGAGGIGASASRIIDAETVPDAASWQVVRAEYKKLQEEIAATKRSAEQASALGSASRMAASSKKQRFSHSPMRAATAATPEDRLSMATDAPGANPLFKKPGALRRGTSRGRLLGKRTTVRSSASAASGSELGEESSPNPMHAAAAGDSKASFEPAPSAAHRD